METKAGDLEGLAKTSTEALKSEERASNTFKSNKPLVVEDAPNPDEDDLDDLDDMLDEFSPIKPDTNEQALNDSGPGRPSVAAIHKENLSSDGITDDDFAAQLQAGMADLLGELQSNPEMQSQFENMLKELGGAGALEEAAGMPSNSTNEQPKANAMTSKAAPVTAAEESFQETIKKTMERMQASGEQATAAAAADDSDDILAELMKQMQSGAGLDGEGSEEDFSKMLLGMMEQLTNKEILYEPMKELDEKFPEWIEKNKAKTPIEDLKRYEEQKRLVREIVAKFEETTYADSNVADREYIVDRMQKMQSAGSPPPDLVGDMAAAQEAFGAPEEGCPQQ